MKSLPLLLLLSVMFFTSCMDVGMNVNVDHTGAITYEGEMDLSSMLPMMMMASQMESDTAREKTFLDRVLENEMAIDTVISFFELDDKIAGSMEITEEMKEKFKVRLQVSEEKDQFRMKFLSRFKSIEEQNEFIASIPKSEEEGAEGLAAEPDTWTALFATELDLEKGVMVFKVTLKEKSDEFGDEDLFMSDPFSEAMPKMKLTLTLPGKVKDIDGAEYRKIDDWKVNIKIPLETDDPEKQFVKVYFEPRSEFSKPGVTELWEPKPARITFKGRYNVPSDAIVLLGESGPGAWTHLDGREVQWDFEDDVLTVKPRTGDIQTRESFGDCQLHVEWRTPEEPDRKDQGKGNSGIFLQSNYEVQVLDSYRNETYSNGQAGSIYKQHIPDVNASRAPGEWQVYDIIYRAPKFDQLGIRESPPIITVIHNGVIIHNNKEIKGTTEFIGLPKIVVHGDAPLKLQDHSNRVSYRNIWIRKL